MHAIEAEEPKYSTEIRPAQSKNAPPKAKQYMFSCEKTTYCQWAARLMKLT